MSARRPRGRPAVHDSRPRRARSRRCHRHMCLTRRSRNDKVRSRPARASSLGPAASRGVSGIDVRQDPNASRRVQAKFGATPSSGLGAMFPNSHCEVSALELAPKTHTHTRGLMPGHGVGRLSAAVAPRRNVRKAIASLEFQCQLWPSFSCWTMRARFARRAYERTPHRSQ